VGIPDGQLAAGGTDNQQVVVGTYLPRLPLFMRVDLDLEIAVEDEAQAAACDVDHREFVVERVEQRPGGVFASASDTTGWLIGGGDLNDLFFDEDLTTDGGDVVAPERKPETAVADAVLRQLLSVQGVELFAESRIGSVSWPSCVGGSNRGVRRCVGDLAGEDERIVL
jgi:hypothetical protein